jgi:hypothetical protein
MQKNDLTALFPRREKLLDKRQKVTGLMSGTTLLSMRRVLISKSYRMRERYNIRCGERSDEAISCVLRRLWCHEVTEEDKKCKHV